MNDDSRDTTETDATAGEQAEAGVVGDDRATFQEKLESARALLETEESETEGSETAESETEVSALHVGVVRGDRVDTSFAQLADGPREEGLQALTLLATHLRLVAEEAGVGYDTVAADAAQLANQLEESEIPTPPGDDEE